MRAASLPRFLPDQPAARVAAFALFVALAALTVLFVFAATGAGEAELMAPADVLLPFRWLTPGMA